MNDIDKRRNLIQFFIKLRLRLKQLFILNEFTKISYDYIGIKVNIR
jgi:hypothetical protein